MNSTLKHDRAADAAAQNAFTSEGGRSAIGIPPRDTGGEQRLMDEFGVHFDGRAYHFLGYRYDRLEDAVAYARLVRSRASQRA